MTWQLVVELEAATLDHVLTQLTERSLSPDVLKRVRAILTMHFIAATPWVSVFAPGPALGSAQNFFVVQAGAADQSHLELYLY